MASLTDWEIVSSSSHIDFKKGDYVVCVITDPEDSFQLQTTVEHKGNKIDKPFYDLNTAIMWCEFRM